MAKDDIDKIDEQIKNLTEGVTADESEKEEGSGTKEVETISDLKTSQEEAEKENETEKTENIVTKIESEENDNKQEVEEEKVKEEKKEEPSKEPPKNSNSNKKAKITIIALAIGIVVLLTILIIVLIPKKTEKAKVTQKELTASEKKQIIEDYGEALQGIISVYYQKQELLLEYEDAILLVKYDYDVVCEEHEIYDDGTIYLNKCSIDEEEVDYNYGKKQKKEELKEGAIKVYVSKKSKKATIETPKDIKEYDTYSFDIEGKYQELTLLGDKSDFVFYTDEKYEIHMINYKTREKALNSVNYQAIAPISLNDSYDQKYVAVQIDNK